MSLFKEYLAEAKEAWKHPYQLPPAKRPTEAKNALEHSDRRVHHLTMEDHHHREHDKAKTEASKESHLNAIKAHREAQSAHSSAESHIIQKLHSDKPEMFSDKPDSPRHQSTVEKSKAVANTASEHARQASIKADGAKRYVGPHAKFKSGYPKI